VLRRSTGPVLKMAVMTGGVKAGAAEDLMGASVTEALGLLDTIGVAAADEVTAPAIALDEATTGMVELMEAAALLDEATVARVELAGAAALLDDAGLEAPPPVAGDPEIVPNVSSCGATSVPEAISSGPGMG
jgi:hypothetical protein